MVSEEFSLDGKKALVVGDSRFWGGYAATALAEAGADVAVAASSARKLEEAVAGVRRLGRKAVAIATDVTNPAQVQKMVGQVIAELGGVDILVNAADRQFAKPSLEVTIEEWHRLIEANLTSVFLCSQAVGKQMLSQKKGRIINITSCLAERGLANCAAYSAAAAGVLQLTKTLALEWARVGVTVNAIGAGWFSETEETGMAQEELILGYLPLRRYGHPRELGSLLAYLASDATDFVTGQFLYVDGAVMAHA